MSYGSLWPRVTSGHLIQASCGTVGTVTFSTQDFLGKGKLPLTHFLYNKLIFNIFCITPLRSLRSSCFTELQPSPTLLTSFPVVLPLLASGTHPAMPYEVTGRSLARLSSTDELGRFARFLQRFLVCPSFLRPSACGLSHTLIPFWAPSQ